MTRATSPVPTTTRKNILNIIIISHGLVWILRDRESLRTIEGFEIHLDISFKDD